MIASNFWGLKTHLLPAVLPFLLIITLPSPSNACSCYRKLAPCEEFPKASAVFIGKVIGSAEQVTEPDYYGNKKTYDVGIIWFEIEEAFKGIDSRIVEIHSSASGASCGYRFTRQERYLVYAYGNQPGRLGTNFCTRTRPVEGAAEDLQYLRNPPKRSSGARIYGTIGIPTKRMNSYLEYDLDGMSGIRVSIADADGNTISKETDSKGFFEFAPLKPGDYFIGITPPAGYKIKFDRKLANFHRVSDGGCGKSDYGLAPDNSLTGRVLDNENNPVNGALIDLLHVKPEADQLSEQIADQTWTDSHWNRRPQSR